MNTEQYLDFLRSIPAIKITECRLMKINAKCWSLLSDYYLESVKINCYEPNKPTSAAILKIGDVSGRVTCVVKGSSVGLLFGLTAGEWSEIEKLCNHKQQLFYRYFKDGLSSNFSCEQKLFYNFCLCNKKKDILNAIFIRRPNTRQRDRDTPLVHVLELKKCSNKILSLYLNYIREAS